MRVLLTEDIVGLGDIGEQVVVRPGFARNYLFPKGFAVEINSRKGKEEAHRLRQVESKKLKKQGEAEKLADKIRSSSVSFTLKATKAGRVFGSVSAKEISEKLEAEGFSIDRRRVILPEGRALKKAGVHLVEVKLHPDVVPQLKVNIEYSEASVKQEETETQEAKEAIEEAAAS